MVHCLFFRSTSLMGTAPRGVLNLQMTHFTSGLHFPKLLCAFRNISLAKSGTELLEGILSSNPTALPDVGTQSKVFFIAYGVYSTSAL